MIGGASKDYSMVLLSSRCTFNTKRNHNPPCTQEKRIVPCELCNISNLHLHLGIENSYVYEFVIRQTLLSIENLNTCYQQPPKKVSGRFIKFFILQSQSLKYIFTKDMVGAYDLMGQLRESVLATNDIIFACLLKEIWPIMLCCMDKYTQLSSFIL